MLSDDPIPPFRCKLCGEVVVTAAGLKRHVKSKHPKMELHCTICLESVTFAQYGVHVRQHHSNHSVDNPFRDWDNDDHHQPQALCEVEMIEAKPVIEEADNNSIACTLCKQKYSNKANLKKHFYNVHRMKRVKCRVCSREINKKSLRRHIANVHSSKDVKKKEQMAYEEKIPCTICGRKCRSETSLAAHMKNMHEGEQVSCSQCPFTAIKRVMERHIKKEHGEQPIYQCAICMKILKSRSTLNEHMWIHSEHRRYICDICGMRFKRTSNYHGHMKSHEGKKFQCHLCGNYFLRQRYLRVHEETIHDYFASGSRPQEKGFQCGICGVKLKWKNNLMAHMRIHTGEKPYKCKICGDDFTCHGSLRTHMAKHSVCPTLTTGANLIQAAYSSTKGPAMTPGGEFSS